MAPRVAPLAPGTSRGWARFAGILAVVALLCDVGAALVGVGTRGDIAGGGLLMVAGFLVGTWAFGAAGVARAYATASDGRVSGRKRLAVGCLVPLGLVAALLLVWFMWPLWPFWMGDVSVRVWMLLFAAAPLLLAAERLAGC